MIDAIKVPCHLIYHILGAIFLDRSSTPLNGYEQFYQLVGNDNPTITSLFQFKNLRSLCFEILAENEQIYLPQDEVNFNIFEKVYLLKQRQRYPSALIWDEIRSIIKGGQLSLTADYLSENEYKEKGSSRSKIVPANKRSEVYSIAEWYQRKLREKVRFDEIDLTRMVLRIINQKPVKDYQLIVCDEVQDFTELQLELLMQLAAPNGYLFFAGDLHQMISPSGFRWEDLSNRFYEHERQPPIQETLRFNFRSVGSLVNLANQVLKLRYRLLGESFTDVLQSVNNYGEVARLIRASFEQLDKTLDKLNPGDAILVRTNPEREHLRENFQSTLVFTIEEAKGLEFDTIFLVEFFKRHPDLWNTALQEPERLKGNEKPGLVLELNLLYVAITRARRILNVWEEDISPIWKQPELANLCKEQEIKTIIENRFNVKGKDSDWHQRGEYYFKLEFYLQACECFEKAGDRLKHLEAKAKLLQKEGQYQEAARIFSEIEMWESAALLFQRVEQWRAAADCFFRAGKLEQQQICEIRLLEQEGKLAEAAIKWKLVGYYQNAARLFEQVKQWQLAANCWEKLGECQKKRICEIRFLEVNQRWEDAAQEWYILRRFEDEKRCWMNSSNEIKKAEYRAKDFEKQQQWIQASEQYELAKLHAKVTECRQKAVEIFVESGRNKLEIKDYQGALEDCNKALQINPNYPEAYLKRGIANTKLKNYTEAIKDYDQALMINSNYVEAYSHRGQTYRILSERDISRAKELQQRNR